MSWYEYHKGWQDGRACLALRLPFSDVSEVGEDFQRGYADALKPSRGFLNENYQPPTSGEGE